MKKEDEEIAKFIVKVCVILLELTCIIMLTCMAIYIIKTLIGIDIFPNWSPFH